MAFTYNSDVLDEIIFHDQPLNIAQKNTSEFSEIVKKIKKSVNNPEWLELPNNTTEQIYYKEDFLDHTFSEYFLWTNKNSKNDLSFCSLF